MCERCYLAHQVLTAQPPSFGLLPASVLQPWTTAIGGPITFATLKAFYIAAYTHLRSPKVGFKGYIVMSDGWSNTEWNGFMAPPAFQDVLLDIHIYHCFGGARDKPTPWANVQYACEHDLPMLAGLTQRDWTIVGEYSLAISTALPPGPQAWARAFASAQMTAYGAMGPQAGAGAAKGAFFWNFKLEQPSLMWGYLDLLSSANHAVPATPAQWQLNGCNSSLASL